MGAPVDLCWDTSAVRPDERFAYFVEGICRAFTHLDPELSDPDAPFFARIHHREIADSAVTHLSSSRYISRRLPAGIARSEDHAFYLNFMVSGAIQGIQGSQSEAINCGDLFILDNAIPFELNLKSQDLFDSHVVRLRRTPSLEDRRAAPLAFGLRHAGHRLMPLLRMNLALLARTGDAASDAEIGYFGQTVARLVDLILTDDSIETVSSRSGEAWRLIRAVIDRNIGDQEFTLEVLAGRLGVSPRYVQKVCAAQDCTFSGYLRDRRLEMAAHRLQGRLNRPSVEEVAHSCGYRDLSTFYRAFRRRYGMTPGNFRH